MRLLPLYPTTPLAAIETEEARELDPGCNLCSMREGVRHVCLGGEGEPGGLLLVGESPGRNEDQIGRPFVGESGKLLRRLVAKWWTGPVAIDNAIRCAPGAREVKEKHIEMCRGYLAETIAEARPTRIVALGGWAAYSLTGRGVAPFTSRRSYTYLNSGRFGARPGLHVPIFFVLHPAAALRNRFINSWLETDMQWALRTPDPPGLPFHDPAAIDTYGLVRIVDSGETARQAVAELRVAPWVAFDVETAGVLYTPSFRLLCLSFCARGSTSPWAWDAAALANPEALAVLREYLEDRGARKLGQNVKYDEVSVDFALGIKIQGVRGDARLWRKLLEPEADAKLDKMAELVGMGGSKEEARAEMKLYVDRAKKGMTTERRLAKNAEEDAAKAAAGEAVKKRAKLQAAAAEGLAYLHELDRTMPDLAPVIRDPDADWESWGYALIPNDMLLRYNGRDSAVTARLGEWLEPQLAAEPHLDRVRKKIVEPAARAIRSVERWGVAVNRQAVEQFDTYLGTKLDETWAKLAPTLKVHGVPDINLDSPLQVAALLFDKLKLPSVLETKSGGRSTNDEALTALASRHPAVAALVDWRSFSKLRGTYAAGMLRHIRPDGRIHPSILLEGARTGRTSCQNPNLQNIPRPADSIEGKMARDCFVASPGCTLLQFDYSQLELRIAAMLSQDPVMLAIFAEGVDFHQRTAELISKVAWGIDPSQVEKKHRSLAKNVNFGIVYGKTARTFAKEWGVSQTQAQAVVDAIMGKFKVLDAWLKAREQETARTGVAWTWWDGQKARRRPLYRIADADDAQASLARNGAKNTPIQGTASDFCIASLAETVEWIETEGLEDRVKLVLPVHDSLLLDVRNSMLDEVRGTVREIMTGWNSGGVPLVVDEEAGLQWGSLEKLAA